MGLGALEHLLGHAVTGPSYLVVAAGGLEPPTPRL
jgi:hypothetical protein